jgi:hypothetical protein
MTKIMTLLEFYQEIIRNEVSWYYYDLSNSELLNNVEDINEDKCKNLISEILTKGDKTSIDIYKDWFDKIPKDRFNHIISVFLLGYILYNNILLIRNNVERFLNDLPNPNGEGPETRFSYLWMLISLFHDLGYALEYNASAKISNFNLRKFPLRPRYIPAIYSKNTLEKYKKYRKCKFKVRDHGIYGGVSFYLQMCKLRRDKDKNCCGPLDWNEKLEKFFECAAWTIVCHNIFYVNKKSADFYCYKHFKLESLIKDKARIITLKDSPMLFLFSLVDSIEPLKVLQRTNYLKDIQIDFKEKYFVINIESLPCKIREEYRNRIKGLNDWLLDVESYGDDNKLECLIG